MEKLRVIRSQENAWSRQDATKYLALITTHALSETDATATRASRVLSRLATLFNTTANVKRSLVRKQKVALSSMLTIRRRATWVRRGVLVQVLTCA